MVTVQKIKLRRTALDMNADKVADDLITYGEPLYLDDEKCLMIGDKTSDAQGTRGLKVFKAIKRTLINSMVFFKDRDATNIVQLIDEDEKNIYPKTTAGAITYEGDTIQQFLDNLLYAKSRIKGGPSISVDTTAATKNEKYYVTGVATDDTTKLFRASNNNSATVNKSGVYFNGYSGVLYGAAWNDFAEFRKCKADPGRCVIETGDGSLIESHGRLCKGASVVSDTFGMVIGPQNEGYSPIAVAGRVLVYLDNIDTFSPGSAVCSGDFGSVSVMSDYEIRNFPDRIVGYLSEKPTYTKWNNVEVRGRVWMKIK